MADSTRIDLAPSGLDQLDDFAGNYALAAVQRTQDPEIIGAGLDLMFELGVCGIDSMLIEVFGTSNPSETQLILTFGSYVMAEFLTQAIRLHRLAP